MITSVNISGSSSFRRIVFLLRRLSEIIDSISSSSPTRRPCGHSVKNNFIAQSGGGGIDVAGNTNLFGVLQRELAHRYIYIYYNIISYFIILYHTRTHSTTYVYCTHRHMHIIIMHTRSNAHARTHEDRRAHRRSAIEAGRSHCSRVVSVSGRAVVGDDKSLI